MIAVGLILFTMLAVVALRVDRKRPETDTERFARYIKHTWNARHPEDTWE